MLRAVRGRTLSGLPLLFALGATLAGCPRAVEDPDAGFDSGVPFDAATLEGPLRIGTWNIEQFPKAPTTVDRVADLVVRMNLDLVGVQEITDVAAFERLGDALPHHSVVYADDPGGFIVVGIIYRHTRLELSQVNTLFTDDSYTFPRPVLAANVLDRGSGFDFRFHVLHLKANVDEESQARRESAIDRLDVLVQGQLGDPSREQDLIFAGDWNDELTDPSADNVFHTMLDAPETYRFLTLPLEERGEVSFLPFSVFLDHIAVTSDALFEYGDGATTVQHLDETEANYRVDVSDHLPVVAEFQLR